MCEHPRKFRQFCRSGSLLPPLRQDVRHDKYIFPLSYLANEAKSFVLHCLYQTSCHRFPEIALCSPVSIFHNTVCVLELQTRTIPPSYKGSGDTNSTSHTLTGSLPAKQCP